MASIFAGGNVPNRANGMWVIEQKILGAIGALGTVVTGGGGTLQGSGSPEGVVTAVTGTIYTDSTNHTQWNKESGAGNTGWVQYI